VRARARLRERRKPDPARNARTAHRNAREPDEYHHADAHAASDSNAAPEQHAASHRDVHANEYRDCDGNFNAVTDPHADVDAHRNDFADATNTNANGKPNTRDSDALGECCT